MKLKVPAFLNTKTRQLTLLYCLVIMPAYAQSQKAMSVIDFLNIPAVASPRLSPDGKMFVYVKYESNWKENKQIGHIWRKDVSGSNLIQLTNGLKGESSPAWSPDGKYISFITQRKPAKENQIYLIRNIGGEARQLTNHETPVKSVQWSPDAQSLYFLASDPKSKEEKHNDKVKNDLYALDENYKHTHLWRIGLTDSVATKITDGDYSVNSYQLSRDGKSLVIRRGISPLYDESTTNEVWLMNHEGKNPVQLTFNHVSESSASLSPLGNQILFTVAANEQFEKYYNRKLFLIPTGGGDAVMPLKATDYEVSRAKWSGDGKTVYLLMNMGVEEQLFSFSPSNGKLKQITKGDHAISQWHYNHRLDQHILAINHAKNAGDFYLMKGTDFKNIKRLTEVYDYLDKEFLLPKQEKVSWRGEDGVTVEGLLYYPANYTKGTRYPLVVQTHGGPASSDKFGISRSFTHYNPVLTGKGYMVLRPNYRGSTGYGDEFLRDMVGSYFKNSHLDVMKGVDYLIEQGLADPEKLIKMGWSAGGHMTNKIITHTDRFKAASSGAGAANWVSMYGQSDVRIYRTPWFGGTPWEENAPINLYWEHSPLKDIHKVKTPTLVLVGGKDVRVPPPQSVEMYRALKSHKVPAHLYIAPREPHGWRELRHRLHKINLELDWFAEHALGEKYTWESVAEDKLPKEEEEEKVN